MSNSVVSTRPESTPKNKRRGGKGGVRSKLKGRQVEPQAREDVLALLGTGVRVLHAPCVGRCETAPVVVVGQNPIPRATVEQVTQTVQASQVTHPSAKGAVTPGHVDYAGYRAAGGYALAASCVSG